MTDAVQAHGSLAGAELRGGTVVWRRGWNSEIISERSADSRVLIVGAGVPNPSKPISRPRRKAGRRLSRLLDIKNEGSRRDAVVDQRQDVRAYQPGLGIEQPGAFHGLTQVDIAAEEFQSDL
jgi:hypothetical protein